MAVLCGMPTIQYSARSARLSVRGRVSERVGDMRVSVAGRNGGQALREKSTIRHVSGSSSDERYKSYLSELIGG